MYYSGFGYPYGGCGCGSAYPVVGTCGLGANWFALIVVLFILLIIVGAVCFPW